ncbi:MAG: SPL family radical SAM protein [Bacteroidota bacterium]
MSFRSILSKSILNKTKRRDPWFLDDYTLNPYSGCAFNCWYCYIRGSKYGEHMEDKLAYKENAVQLLEKELALRARKSQYGFIVLSSATEPYQLWEEQLQLTRQLLEVILHFRFPVHIITKSTGVVRDFDLLQKINQQAVLPSDLAPVLAHKALVTFSFSTLDDSVARFFEPGATPPSLRLQALEQTVKAGFPAGVSLMPLLPYISDTHEALVNFYSMFKSLGAHYVFPASLTLFGSEAHDSKPLTLRAVRQYRAELAPRYEELYSNDQQLAGSYQREFKKRVGLVRGMYPIPESIISLS